MSLYMWVLKIFVFALSLLVLLRVNTKASNSFQSQDTRFCLHHTNPAWPHLDATGPLPKPI